MRNLVMARATRVLVLLGAAVCTGCSSTYGVSHVFTSDACRSECSKLDEIEVPRCLFRGSVRNELTNLFDDAFEILNSEFEFQEGACGCLTTAISRSGRFEDVQLIYAHRVDEPDRIVRAVERVQSDGPTSEKASCIVGITAPITFQK